MSSFKADVVTDILGSVRVVYLNRQVSSWWNERRSESDLRAFCGWYWIRGTQEAGPFRTRSAAMRDAWYHFVAHQQVPKMWNIVEMPRALRRSVGA